MSGSSRISAANTRQVTTFIVIWAVAILALMSVIMAAHMTPLPVPKSSATSGAPPPASMVPSVAAEHSNTWQMVHILVAGCPCSAYTAKALNQRGPSALCRETVIVLGGPADWQTPLGQAGFNIRNMDGDQLLRETGIAGGPWLLILSPSGQMAYSGGYAAERPRPGIALHDLDLLASAMKQQPVPAFAAYGCAATPLLQGKLSPVRICQAIE